MEILGEELLGADCLTDGLDDLPVTAGDDLLEERSRTEGAGADLRDSDEADLFL